MRSDVCTGVHLTTGCATLARLTIAEVNHAAGRVTRVARSGARCGVPPLVFPDLD
jgi:hypothetical protein